MNIKNSIERQKERKEKKKRVFNLMQSLSVVFKTHAIFHIFLAKIQL